MTDEKLLTINEVADRLCVSVSAVRKWKREGKIAYIKIEGSLRFHPADLDDFLQNRRSAV